METLKTLLIPALLLSASLASAGGNNIAIRCVGDTNYGDDLDIEFRANGDCEGPFGQTYYCESEVIMHKDAYTHKKGESSKLFVQTVEHTMVYENEIIADFRWKGKVINLMSWKTSPDAYNGMAVNVNFGGSRTSGSANCKRVR